MMTDFRALCAELLDWAEVTAAHYIQLPAVMLRARAALAKADEPAVPEGREPAAVTGQPNWRGLCEELVDAWLKGDDIVSAMNRARAVLARWGNPTPQPPEPGEVGVVVAWLRATGEGQPCLSDECYARLTRAADLLESLSPPQPVPVSERLPGAEETTEDGEVWIEDPGHDYPLADTGDYDWEPHRWVLREIGKFDAKNNLHWLPAHALPLPEVGE